MRSKAKIAALVALVLGAALILTACSCGGTSPIGYDNSFGRTAGLIILGTDDTTNKAVECWKTLGATKGWDIQESKPEANIDAVKGVLTQLYTTVYGKDANGQGGRNASIVVVAGGNNELSNQICQYINDTNLTNSTVKDGSKVTLTAFFIGTAPADTNVDANFKDKVKTKEGGYRIWGAPQGVVTAEGVTVGQLAGDLCFQQIVYAFDPNVAFDRTGAKYTDVKRRLTVNPADVSANLPAEAAKWDTATYMKERIKNTFKWELANYYH